MHLNWGEYEKQVQETSIIPEHMQFQTPARILVYGSSTSGKTTLITNILERHETLFQNRINNVLYINTLLDLDSALYNPTENIEKLRKCFPKMMTTHEIPKEKDDWFQNWCLDGKTFLEAQKYHKAVVFDDFQECLGSVARRLTSFFANISHHFNISVFATLQNPKVQGQHANDALSAMANNLTSCIIMPNPSAAKFMQILEHRHNPLMRCGIKNGSDINRCLAEVKRFHPYPYVICCFNQWNSRRDKFPVYSLICNEIDANVIAMLFPSDLFNELTSE